MKTKIISLVAGATVLSTSAFAGRLDNAGQSINPLFEKGRYAEFSMGFLNGDVTGVDPINVDTNDVAPGIFLFTGAYKADINDRISYAFIVDQPFGRETKYEYAGALNGVYGKINTAAITGILRYKFNDNFSIHGGLRAQRANAAVKLPGIRNTAGTPVDQNYSLKTDTVWGYGYVIGGAYEIPEYAVRVAVTYNSKIKHSLEATESSLTTGYADRKSPLDVETPESVNLDVQFPVSESTLVFGGLRWVNWKDVKVTPALYESKAGKSLLSYDSNTITYRLGVAQKFNENWTGLLLGGYEKSTGDEAGPFGPTDGYISAGIGAIYTKDNLRITGVINHTWAGDAKGASVGTFKDNSAYSGGFKFGYTF